MTTKVYDSKGKLIEIQENGETVWTEDDSLRRDKIGDKTAQKLKDANSVKDLKKYLARVHDVDLGGSSG
jgi:hypothetical protein